MPVPSKATRNLRILWIVAGVGISTLNAMAATPGDLRKDATAATKTANDSLLNTLPFSDKTDFDDAHKGFMAPLPTAMIKGAAGNLIWDPQKYGFIKEGVPAPASVNPSLWRNAQLINISGLFEVVPGIYQVRNQDLSNMTIIEGTEGVTIVDPLISTETAKVALLLDGP